MKGKTLLDATINILQNQMGEDITVLDMSKVTVVSDFFVIVSSNSAPHLDALADQLARGLKGQGVPRPRKSGTANSGWVVYDFFDVVVHIMSAEMREYYSLEELWGDAPKLAVAG